MKRSSTEFIIAVVIILVGLVFLVLAWQIDTPVFQTTAEALVGPSMAPIAVASLILGLGTLELFSAMFAGSKVEHLGQEANIHDSSSEFSPFSANMAARMATTVGIGFAYIWLLSATGYIISTAIVLCCLLVLFGTRSPGKIALLTIGGTAAYYFVFIRLMGIYDPAGWLLSVG